MADTLVNHSYTSLAQGVSQQATEARHETQSEDMINCIPHPSRGVMRRNPVNFVGTLLDKDGVPVAPGEFFMYTYDRGTVGEQYVVLLGCQVWYVYGVDGTLRGSWNDDTNKDTDRKYLNCNGKHPKDVFSIVTVGDNTWISNNTIEVKLATTVDGSVTDAHISTMIYTVKSTGNVVTGTAVTTTSQTPTITGYTYNVKVKTALGNSSTASITGGSAGSLLSGISIATAIKDQLNTGRQAAGTTIITTDERYVFNYTGTSTLASSFAGVYSFTWEGVSLGTSTTNTLVKGIYTYKAATFIGVWIGSLYTITRSHVIDVPDLEDLNELTGLWRSDGPTVYRKNMKLSDTVEYSDSFGNTASGLIKGVVTHSEELPATLPTDLGNVLIKVDNSTEAEGGEYWLEWNETAWVESRAGGLLNYLDAGSMPHSLIRAENGEFVFGFLGEFDGSITDDVTPVPVRTNSSLWNHRTVGDLTSAPAPSFVGKTISDLFVHGNRLGILAEDSIVLSELSSFENFWPTTVRTIPATDMIDVVVATKNVTGLKQAISLSGILILFSDDAQFSLTGEGGPLTPESASVGQLSNYNYNATAPAKVLGNKIMFTTTAANSTQVFTLATDQLGGTTSNVVAENASLHIPSFLPKDIYYIETHSILGYTFMLSKDPAEAQSIYVLNTLDIGGQSAQTAFHKWEFGATILGISIVSNTLLVLASYNGVLTGVSINLDVQADTSLVTYNDNFDAGTPLNYDSYLTLSKWFLKDSTGFGNKRGRLQVRTAEFSVGPEDEYKVELFNDSLLNPSTTNEDWVMTNAVWDDTAEWGFNDTDADDTQVVWKDSQPYFSRKYYNDEKVTVTSNSATTFIRFSNNELAPTKGFTLGTVNLEGLFRQRSQRT